MFKNRINILILFLSAVMGVNSLFFIVFQGAIFPSLQNYPSHILFCLIYFAGLIFGVGGVFLSNSRPAWHYILSKVILIYLPTEIIFIYGLQKITTLTPYVGLLSALYLILAGVFIIKVGLISEARVKIADHPKKNTLETVIVAGAIIFIMSLNFFFGFYNLGKMAVVDEPLWTFNRIPNFWRDIGESDWRNARASDKPGLTVAVISGVGLFSEPYPKQYKNITWDEKNFNLNANKMESFNISFRLPILIFSVLMIPLFYLMLKRLVGKNGALLSTIFIGLSPILLGTSRIINPDSILWIFTSFSIICYLLYLKNNRRIPLYWSAFFLGLAILTKYTANILYLFFFSLIFIEYIFHNKKFVSETVNGYFKKRFIDFVIFSTLSLIVIYVLYPAVWGKPSRLPLLTIQSQAFETIWPFFSTLLSVVAFDIILLKSYLLKKVMAIFIKLQRLFLVIIPSIFLISIAGVLINIYTNMKYFDFEAVLSSPKSSFSTTGYIGFFLANFYPLVFGISAVAIIAIVIFLINSYKDNKFLKDNIIVIYYLLFFILVYYIGSVFTHVASIIRYQVIVFPIIFIASGIALSELLKMFIPESKTYFKKSFYTLSLLIMIASTASLYQVRPFYMGYASFLLPERYYLDIKDMGEGSYEAAEYLNSIPNAGNLDIWTDKKGVCTFFIGKCHSSLSAGLFNSDTLDYLVISSGRESRTTKMSAHIKIGDKTFQDVYNSEDIEYKVVIAGRENNYVKIININNVKNK